MLIKIILLAFIVNFVSSDCPLFDTVANLNLEQQIGTWQVHGILKDPESIGNLECLSVAISGSNLVQAPVNLSSHVHGTDLDKNNSMIMLDVLAEVSTLARPGRWNVYYNNVTFTGSVIYTDYVEYSLLVLCYESISNDQEVIALFLSRSHAELPANVLDGFTSALTDEYGIDTSNYKPITHHHHCGHH